MIIDCISDLHGYCPKLDGGDLLIVAGDLTASDKPAQYNAFASWLMNQQYHKKIVISGNHDNYLVGLYADEPICKHFDYLCDSGTEFDGLKIWGSPWTRSFEGMNPACKAFTLDTEEELAEKWALIPDDIDILVTHSPPSNVLDEVGRFTKSGIIQVNVGSSSLGYKLCTIQPKLHVFGHVHEHGEKTEKVPMNSEDTLICVNASHVNEHYKPVNPPIRVIL
jgi:Icc-related predicted phosphoesterase